MEKPSRVGSSKIMTAVEPGVVSMHFTDGVSVFDRGTIPQPFPGLGVSRCKAAVRSFKLARVAGFETHFIRQVSEDTVHVREFGIPGLPALSGKVHGRTLPLEFLERSVAAGSLVERAAKGLITPESLGYSPGTEVKTGMLLPRPQLECTTKFEKVDRNLTDTEAKILAGLDNEEWRQVWGLVVGVSNITTTGYNLAGFGRWDSKKEAALTYGGRLVIVDAFGTQDEDRIVDVRTGEFYCKDLVRDPLRGTAWKAELDRAKAEFPDDKDKWPPYPRLTDDLIDLVCKRYAEAARRYENATFQ